MRFWPLPFFFRWSLPPPPSLKKIILEREREKREEISGKWGDAYQIPSAGEGGGRRGDGDTHRKQVFFLMHTRPPKKKS